MEGVVTNQTPEDLRALIKDYAKKHGMELKETNQVRFKEVMERERGKANILPIPKFKTYKAEHEQRALAPIKSEHIRAFASVFDETRYDVGGTFTFTNGNTIDEEQAKYFIRVFLNQLDKAYFNNKAARKNIRVERQVFIHRTHKGGRYIHFHIWFPILGNIFLFNETLKEVWKQSNAFADEAEVKPLVAGSGLYGWREHIAELGNEDWMTIESHEDLGSKEYLEARQGLSQATLNRLAKIHYQADDVVERIKQERPMRKRKQRQRDWVNRSGKQKQDLLH
jgi:hypothetical protein